MNVTSGQDKASTPGTDGSIPAILSEHYTVLGVLGEGTFGKVYLVRTRDDPTRRLAAKHMKPGKPGDGACAAAVREVSLLRALRGPHVVGLARVLASPRDGSLVLCLEAAAHDVHGVLSWHREAGAALPLYTFKSLAWQLLRGIAALHGAWVLHRDLKPANLLLMGPGPEHGVLKIADFGLARVSRAPLEPLWHNGAVVTLWYRAPELLLGAAHHTTAVDVWAAGCILGELLTLRPLFAGEERGVPPDPRALQADQLRHVFASLGHPGAAPWEGLEALHHWRDNTEGVRLRTAEHGSRPLRQLLWEQSPLLRAMPSPELAVDLISRLLTMDPAKRLSAREALDHAFFSADPLPGMNAFVHMGKQLVHYPSAVLAKA